MGLLDHLWDDTVAGPRPDPAAAPAAAGGLPVTRSITILRSLDIGSEPGSPLTPATPRTPRGDWRKPRRELAVEPRSPTACDWVVISALDK